MTSRSRECTATEGNGSTCTPSPTNHDSSFHRRHHRHWPEGLLAHSFAQLLAAASHWPPLRPAQHSPPADWLELSAPGRWAVQELAAGKDQDNSCTQQCRQITCEKAGMTQSDVTPLSFHSDGITHNNVTLNDEHYSCKNFNRCTSTTLYLSSCMALSAGQSPREMYSRSTPSTNGVCIVRNQMVPSHAK